MRTPRELLTGRHKAAEQKLTAIRQRVVHDIAEESIQVHTPEEQRASLAEIVWHELFVACRRYWTGLGATWGLILVFALSTHPERAVTEVTIGSGSSTTLNALREQQRLRDELLGVAVVQNGDLRVPILRPRSDVRITVRNT